MDWEFIAFVFAVALVILVPAVLKARARRAGFDLIARALERGQALDGDTILRLAEDKSVADRRRGNLAAGVVLSALAIAALLSGVILNTITSDAQWQDFFVPAVFLGALGGAFLLLAGLDRAGPPAR